MDGIQVPDAAPAVAGHHDDDLCYLLAICGTLLRDMRLPEGAAELIERFRQLDELKSALDTIRTRLEVAAVLGHVPGATPGPGNSRMASEAVARLVRAMIVIARRDT
jgi:hypothetical protein